MAARPNPAIGVAGWSYPDWEGVVYERGVRDRLGWLLPYVDMLEINRTFYRPPVARECEAWARAVRGRPGFFFSAKVGREATHGSAPPDPALAAAFREGLAPLREAGLLRHLLAQFRYDFRDDPAGRERLLRIRDLFGPLADPLVLELRHGSWQEPAALDWLEGLGVTVAHLDYPAGPGSFDLRDRVVGADAYFRLHGRNRKAWYDREAGRDETYNYLYGPGELDGIGLRMDAIKAKARTLTVVMNNHYQGRELVNALQLRAREKGGRIPVPPPLVLRYPVLREIADAPAELW